MLYLLSVVQVLRCIVGSVDYKEGFHIIALDVYTQKICNSNYYSL